jgi:SOS-response transcriptional repressor LexA
MTVDKIKHHVDKHIIDTINECVNLRETEILKKWLADCKKEIEFRQSQKIDTYPLFYELAYLEMVQ